VFLNWKKRPLSATGVLKTEPCRHPPRQAGRLSLTPLISVTERIDGRPRRRVIHRFGVSIRPCCIADRDAPQTRLAFWDVITESFERAPAEVASSKERFEAEIAEKVPRPTPTEKAIWEVFKHTFGLSCRTYDAATWRLMSARWRAYQDQCRPGESYTSWFKRAERSSSRPLPSPPSSFAQLGLSWPCTDTEVRRAWKLKAAASHPDRGGDHQTFINLTRARDEALRYVALRREAGEEASIPEPVWDDSF